MRNNQRSYFCRVCGKAYDEPIWGEDNQSPSFDFCSCCGVEFGYGDCNMEAVRLTWQKWIAAGSKWVDPKEKPKEWSLDKQLDQIRENYK